jgi:hypothetical protein
MSASPPELLTEGATSPDWMEIARLILAAPHAADEVDVLLVLYEHGRLPLEALEHSLRALGVRNLCRCSAVDRATL